jgi:hypothetical protein
MFEESTLDLCNMVQVFTIVVGAVNCCQGLCCFSSSSSCFPHQSVATIYMIISI